MPAKPTISADANFNASKQLGAAPPAGQVSPPQLMPDLRRLLEEQNAYTRETALHARETKLLVRENALISRELLKHFLGQPTAMPPTPTLDTGLSETPPPGRSSCTGVGTAGSVENRPTHSGLGPISQAQHGINSVGDRELLGIGHPPQHHTQQAIESHGFANGVTFNIGSLTQPVTVSALPDRSEMSTSSPAVPGSAHLPESQQQQQQHHQHHFTSQPSAELQQAHGTTGTHMYRDTSQAHMSGTPSNPSYSLPVQQPTIQTPHLSSAQEDQEIPPGPAAPVQAQSYIYAGATYNNFHQGGYVRPPMTMQQQQAYLQQQQQQQHMALVARSQQQAAIAARNFYGQYQQEMPGGMASPGNRIMAATPTMGRPQRPHQYVNVNPSATTIQAAEDAERSASDSAAAAMHAQAQAQLSPAATQFARMQRAPSAMSHTSHANHAGLVGYMRQVSGQVSTSPSTATFPGHPAHAAQEYGGVATPSLGADPFVGAVGIQMTAGRQSANASATNANSSPAVVTNNVFGGGGGGGVGGLPSGSTDIASGGSSGIVTPSMPSLYYNNEPSPFTATFPTVGGGTGQLPSPFAFAHPEMEGRSRWGEDEGDEEKMREVTPGRRV